MKPEERTAIIKVYQKIITTVAVGWDSVLEWLIQDEIIRFEDKDIVDSQRTSREKVKKMIDFVMHSDDPEAFSMFVKALRHSHRFLATDLQKMAEKESEKESQKESQQEAQKESQKESPKESLKESQQESQMESIQESEQESQKQSTASARPTTNHENRLRALSSIKQAENPVENEEESAWQPAHPIRRQLKRSVKAGLAPQPSSETPLSASIEEEPTDEPVSSPVSPDSKMIDRRRSEPPPGPSQPRPRLARLERQQVVMPEHEPIEDQHKPVLEERLQDVEPGEQKCNKDLKTQTSNGTKAATGDLHVGMAELSLRKTYTCTLKRFNSCIGFGFKFVSGQLPGRDRFPGDNSFYISVIEPYGIAAISDKMRVKDTIVSVNGKQLQGMEFEDVSEMLQKALQIDLVMERYHPEVTKL